MLTSQGEYSHDHFPARSLPLRSRAFSFFALGHYSILFSLGGYYLAIALILRIVLFLVFGLGAGTAPIALPQTLLAGMVNDCIALLALLLPLSVVLLIIPDRLQQSQFRRMLRVAGIWISLFGIGYLAVIQFYFFKEFNSQFNLVAVDYLIYPHEVFINIYESYPVFSIAVLVAILATGVLKLNLQFIRQPANRAGFAARLRFVLLHAACVLFFSLFFSTHSLDFSSNRIVNEIAANGLSSFFQALRTNHLDFDEFYRTGDAQQMQRLLAGQLANDSSRSVPDGHNFNRTAAGVSGGLGKMNVVVIVEESFGCEQVDACGQGLDVDRAIAAKETRLTPHFDQLAKQGYFFNKAYATGTRTVRGLEAITASFPPIPSESIIKRPGSEHMSTWGKVMRENGYRTSFLYGGYSQFDNMKAFYAGNGFDVNDRLEIDNPRFTNIWGVSDQDLFQHAQAYYDREAARGTPFFSIIMTTSNHSPYTFPPDIQGVRAKGGDRMDGVRYADHALGEFFANSTHSSWYKNTLFVVVADHGARVYGSQEFPLSSYEIPLLFFAPGHLQPSQFQAPISQMDIAPTVLGLLGLPYTAPFFGQNVFAEGELSRILLFNHNHDVALYQGGELVTLGLQKSAQTYTYQLGQPQLVRTNENRHLTDLATAYYQTAFNLFTQK